MALTVGGIVSDVVGRLRGKLAFVSLSVVKDDTNADLVPAVRDALAYVGVAPADPATVTDADLAAVANPKMFRDAATLETLYLIRGAFAEVDETLGVHQQRLSQFADQLNAMIADFEARVPKPNIPAASLGSMTKSPIPNDPFDPCRSRSDPLVWPYPT